MPSVGPRLATACILLALQTLVLILELLVFNPSIKTHRGYTSLRQWFGPIGLALLSVALVPAIFAHPKAGIEMAGTQCTLVVDADIAGEGVRVAAFVQVCVLIIVSLLGSFHPEATGMKEVGAGLVLTSVSLAIALIVRMARGSLTPVDAAISAMILDGQNMALAIQLTAKETLSSRWQVRIVVAAQALGLGTIVAIVARFNDRKFLSDSCTCLTVFWWGWLGNCLPSASSLEPSIFWTYFACRFVGISQASFHALWNMEAFDSAEKDTRETADELKKLGAPLLDITYPHFTQRGHARFGEYPASVTFMYLFYGVLALTSLVTAETTIKDLNIIPSSAIDSTGQIIALVIAGSTFVRAFWLFAFLFMHQKSWKGGFKWPFKLQLSNFSSAPTYIKPPHLDYRPEALPLGSMLRDPFDLDSKYKDHVEVLERHIRESEKNGWEETIHYHHSSGHTNSSVFSHFSFKTNTVEASQMKTQCFEPGEDYLKACAAEPEIRRNFGPGTGSVTIYLVLSRRIAEGLRLRNSEGVQASVHLGPAMAMTGVPVELGPEMGGGEERADTQTFDRKRLYAYRVQEYILTADGAVR